MGGQGLDELGDERGGSGGVLEGPARRRDQVVARPDARHGAGAVGVRHRHHFERPPVHRPGGKQGGAGPQATGRDGVGCVRSIERGEVSRM